MPEHPDFEPKRQAARDRLEAGRKERAAKAKKARRDAAAAKVAAAALAAVAFVAVVLAILALGGLIFMFAWNVGLTALVAAAGGTLGNLGYFASVGCFTLLSILGNLIRRPAVTK